MIYKFSLVINNNDASKSNYLHLQDQRRQQLNGSCLKTSVIYNRLLQYTVCILCAARSLSHAGLYILQCENIKFIMHDL